MAFFYFDMTLKGKLHSTSLDENVSDHITVRITDSSHPSPLSSSCLLIFSPLTFYHLFSNLRRYTRLISTLPLLLPPTSSLSISLCQKLLNAPSVIILPIFLPSVLSGLCPTKSCVLGQINKPSVAYWEPIAPALPRRQIILLPFFSLVFSVWICLVWL